MTDKDYPITGADVNIQDEDGNTAAHLAQMPKSSSAVGLYTGLSTECVFFAFLFGQISVLITNFRLHITV